MSAVRLLRMRHTASLRLGSSATEVRERWLWSYLSVLGWMGCVRATSFAKHESRTPPVTPLTGPTTSCPYPHPLTRVPAKAGGSLLFQGDPGSNDLRPKT